MAGDPGALGSLVEVWQRRSRRRDRPARAERDAYKDDVPNVRDRRRGRAPFAAIGRVVGSTLPAGCDVTATRRGPVGEVGATHEAVIQAMR